MVYVDRSQAAAAFLTLLDHAVKLVGDRWFLMPFASVNGNLDTAEYRERVYCYELYHQIRVLSESPWGKDAGAPDYLLSGEIDKAGLNAVIPDGRQKPDLVWHVPGTSAFNAAVVEVKRSQGLDDDSLCKDLNTLRAFVEAPGRSYEQAVLLVFGPASGLDLRTRVRGVADAVEIADPTRMKIHLFRHEAVGRGLVDLGTLAG